MTEAAATRKLPAPLRVWKAVRMSAVRFTSREVALIAGVSHGNTRTILRALREHGFLAMNRPRRHSETTWTLIRNTGPAFPIVRATRKPQRDTTKGRIVAAIRARPEAFTVRQLARETNASADTISTVLQRLASGPAPLIERRAGGCKRASVWRQLNPDTVKQRIIDAILAQPGVFSRADIERATEANPETITTIFGRLSRGAAPVIVRTPGLSKRQSTWCVLRDRKPCVEGASR